MFVNDVELCRILCLKHKLKYVFQSSLENGLGKQYDYVYNGQVVHYRICEGKEFLCSMKHIFDRLSFWTGDYFCLMDDSERALSNIICDLNNNENIIIAYEENEIKFVELKEIEQRLKYLIPKKKATNILSKIIYMYCFFLKQQFYEKNISKKELKMYRKAIKKVLPKFMSYLPVKLGYFISFPGLYIFIKNFLEFLANTKQKISNCGNFKKEYKQLEIERKRLFDDNEWALRELEKISLRDTIEHPEEVTLFLQKMEERKVFSDSPVFNYDPGNYYGIRENLFRYAGIPFDRNVVNDYCVIEHGVHLGEGFFQEESKDRFTSYIVLGEHRRQFTKKRFDLPIFDIGPYINYADDFYSEEEYIKKKDEWGRTLLIFYAHNIEGNQMYFENESFWDIIEKYRNDFDTIALNCYWADLDKEYVDEFRKRRVKIVCAGFRSDKYFLSKLKSTIKLADCVITNDVGTHCAYVLSLGKPMTFIETKQITDTIANMRNEHEREDYYEIVKRCFVNKEGKINDVITENQKLLAEYYFSISKKYSKENMCSIFTLAQEIYQKSNKTRKGYVKIVKKLMQLPQYQWMKNYDN